EGGGQQGPAELVLHGVLGTWRNGERRPGAVAGSRSRSARRQYDSEWNGWFHEIITPSRCAASHRAGGRATMPAWTSSSMANPAGSTPPPPFPPCWNARAWP